METQKTIKGTILKMVVNFNYPADPSVNLDDINWYTEWFFETYRDSKAIKIEKADHKREHDEQTGKSTWYAYVDTNLIAGKGRLSMRLRSEIPDEYMSTGIRPEYAETATDVIVY